LSPKIRNEVISRESRSFLLPSFFREKKPGFQLCGNDGKPDPKERHAHQYTGAPCQLRPRQSGR
jgi:hypothetical protein